VKILFALPGLHRVNRGAEVAFIEVARALADGGDEVTLIGSGQPRPGEPYRFIHSGAIARERFERFPTFPFFRSDTAWEEASFAVGLLKHYRPSDYDVTVTCGFPFTNMLLRRPVLGHRRPAHVFVTQNGDWPAYSRKAEFRLFGCDGLVCINPDYEARNRDRYRTALIPNGVDLDRFRPGPSERDRLGLPDNVPIILMVSALIPSKNVQDAVLAVAKLPDAHLIVAGDGPLRDEIDALAAKHLPGRFGRISVPSEDMPALYRSADVFLHLSRDESFGNVYVEALACGVPIVAYDEKRTRWILGDAARYAGPTADDIARETGEALKQPATDRVQGDRAARYGWRPIAEQYRMFFSKVVNSVSDQFNDRPASQKATAR
jgi:glycosyltransferase involved in cell wall biosynthesis